MSNIIFSVANVSYIIRSVYRHQHLHSIPRVNISESILSYLVDFKNNYSYI